jgi:PAS domain S-box-containing protein
MTACGGVLRRLGRGAANLEVVAERLVRYLYTSFTTAQTGTPACVLVRLFKTTPYSRLTPDLQKLATTRLRKRPPYPSLTCLTLLASAGVIPGWNDPACSSRFRLIPLGDPDDLAQLPMFSQLFHQLNLPQPQPTESGHNLLLDSQEHLFNVFHVLRAEGSPYIPAQEEFVLRYGVRSVLGFGAPLPNGDLFSLILFSTQIIPEATAQLFKPLALCAQIALAPHAERGPSPCVPEPHPPIKGTNETDPTLPQLQGRIAQLEKLLAVHEQTVNIQANRTDTIVSGAGIGTWEWDIPSGYVTFNHQWARMLGYGLEDLEPHVRTWEDLVHPDDKPAVMEAVSAHLLGKTAHYSSEHRLRNKEGAWRWVFASGRVLIRDASGAALRAAGIHLDISARKALEEAESRAQQGLLEKQQALDEAQTLAHLGSWDWTIATGAEQWSDECCRIFGLDPVQTTPSYDLFMAAVHPDDRNRVQEAVNASLHHDTPYNLECRIIRPTGEIRHTHCRGAVHRDAEGRPLTMVGTVLDISDYKRTESALRASEEKVRSVLDNAIDGIIIIDDHGRIESVNPAALTLLAYDEQDLLGQSVTMLMPSSYRERHDRFLATHPVSGQRSIIGTARDVQALRKDGTVVDVHVSVSEILIGHSRKYTGMLRDISERKRMENALLESEERFRQLATHIDAVFWLTSADKQEMLYISPAFETIWGRSRDALYADPLLWIEYIHPDDRERIGIAAACQTSLPYDEEYRIVTSSGDVRWIRDRGFPVKNHDGTVYRLAGIAVDITDAKRMEDAVRASELRYRSLVELSPNAVFVTSDDRLVFANQACATLLGAMSVSQLIGRPIGDFLQRETRALVEERLRTAQLHDVGSRRVEEVSRLDGRLMLAEIAAASVTYEGKTATLVIVTDVTERTHLEDALLSTNAQLIGILNAARGLSIIATDTKGIITTFNTGAEVLLGYSAEEMIGKHSPDILHLPTELEQRAQQLSRLYGIPLHGFDVLAEHARHGGYDEREWTYVRKDGTRFTTLLTVTALRDVEHVILGYLAVGKDITQRKQAEVALVLAAQEMESKNKELAKARDEALQAVQLKADFLATMSHEIRTPMNAIIGMTGLLLDTALTAEQHEFADTVRRSSDSLLTLVNDILDFSKIEAGKLQFETLPFDLRTTVEDTLELLAEQAQSKGLELIGLIDTAVSAAVVGDPGRLRQILVNLVGNAIKFTTTGEVFLHVTRDREAGPDHLRFTIKDTGIGIPETVQTRLFQAFSQADSSTTRRYGGTGLGLAISQRLVHQMQGRIGVDSRPGQGSTFWFTAQFPETTLNVTPAPLSPSQLRGRRILLVNPNRTARHALQQQLVAYGIDCVAVHNGANAYETVRGAVANQNPFDLALIELHLPEMDGLETARRLKNDSATAAMRTVILTTMGRRGDGSAAQAIGIDAYLTKPLRQSQLLHCLCRLMGGAGSETATEQVSTTPLITRHTLAEAHTSPITRLLLAEDNPVNQKVACKMLEKLGCRVDVVGNGQEAVAAHERAPYQLIFMDCQMPEMDGFEATALIRKMEGSSTHTPIVAMTANAMKGDREKCLASGMDDYVAKPIRPKDLQTILDQWLPKRTGTAA